MLFGSDVIYLKIPQVECVKTAWRGFVVMTACKCSDDALFVTRDCVTVRSSSTKPNSFIRFRQRNDIEIPCDLQNELKLTNGSIEVIGTTMVYSYKA